MSLNEVLHSSQEHQIRFNLQFLDKYSPVTDNEGSGRSNQYSLMVNCCPSCHWLGKRESQSGAYTGLMILSPPHVTAVGVWGGVTHKGGGHLLILNLPVISFQYGGFSSSGNGGCTDAKGSRIIGKDAFFRSTVDSRKYLETVDVMHRKQTLVHNSLFPF